MPVTDFAEFPVEFPEGARVGVLTTQPLDRVLDYRAPAGGCVTGDFVEVPLGPRKVLGVVWGAGAGDFDAAKLRRVNRVLDVVPMRDEMREFITRVGEYTLTPMNWMLRLATRAPGLGDAPSMRKVYRRGNREPNRMTDARARVLDVLDEFSGLSFTLKELAEQAGVTTLRWLRDWSNRALCVKRTRPAIFRFRRSMRPARARL